MKEEISDKIIDHSSEFLINAELERILIVGMIVITLCIIASVACFFYFNMKFNNKINGAKLLNGAGDRLIIDVQEIKKTLVNIQVSSAKIETEIDYLKKRIDKLEND